MELGNGNCDHDPIPLPNHPTTQLTFTVFSFTLSAVPQRISLSGGRLPSPSPEVPGRSLVGQLVVFTGKLSSLGRRDARALVARLGGQTADDVNAKTTMLVVGGEGFGPTTEEEVPKSNKLKRAEELAAGG